MVFKFNGVEIRFQFIFLNWLSKPAALHNILYIVYSLRIKGNKRFPCFIHCFKIYIKEYPNHRRRRLRSTMLGPEVIIYYNLHSWYFLNIKCVAVPKNDCHVKMLKEIIFAIASCVHETGLRSSAGWAETKRSKLSELLNLRSCWINAPHPRRILNRLRLSAKVIKERSGYIKYRETLGNLESRIRNFTTALD